MDRLTVAQRSASLRITSSKLGIKRESNQTPVVEHRSYFNGSNLEKTETALFGEEVEPEWRVKARMKTGYVALVVALNIGVVPPNIMKTSPCAHLECWIPPNEGPAKESLLKIGRALQSQYERWQPRARYKQCLDPTLEEIKKVCKSMRRSAKKDRILFHYNGRGVPFPTENQEIWVFNKNFTQYIPLSLQDLDTWVGSPAIYVFDCSQAEKALKAFAYFDAQVTAEKPIGRVRSRIDRSTSSSTIRNTIVLAACGELEQLPTNPNLPADIFTSCLTTPIKMALRWFCSRTSLSGIDPDMIDHIPGTVSDRKTPLGELNWIFTAITDTIAWNTLPHHLFQKLFRQDLLAASLMRNFLLAERIMKSCGVNPVSYPKLPPTHQHPLWRAWDLAADLCISQLPLIILKPKRFKANPFFEDQLTAFEVWLEFAGQGGTKPPQQLPIVLQVLLSKQHRFKALELLERFLRLGSWAVTYALSVGIFPYVLKLLQSPVPELRRLLVFIWSTILAYDDSCKVDLLKESGHNYFCTILKNNSLPSEQRAASAFIISVMLDDFRQGQAACLSVGLLTICMECIQDKNALIRKWAILCLAKLWEEYNEAKRAGIRENAHERLCLLLTDPEPIVRAASIYALGTFIGGAADNEERKQIEKNISLTLFVVTADMSSLARKELIFSLSRLVFENIDQFKEAIIEICNEEISLLSELEARKKRRTTRKDGNQSKEIRAKPSTKGSVCCSIWKVILSARTDPSPNCSQLAKELVRSAYSNVISMIRAGNEITESSSQLIAHLQKRVFSASVSVGTPPTLRRKNPLLGSFRGKRLNSSMNNITNVQGVEIEGSKPFCGESFLSQFYVSSYRFFYQPHGRECTRDISSPSMMEREWRLQRQIKYSEQAEQIKQSVVSPKKLDSQIALMNDNETEVASLIELHPTEPLCMSTDGRSWISIWNWKECLKLQSFSNQNPSGTRITSLRLINTQEQFMLLVGSNDGIVRVWGHLYDEPTLITAWRSLSDTHSLYHNSRSSGLTLDWNQGNGQLMTSGDVPVIRVWDVERELSIQDIPTGTESTCVTSLRHQPTSSRNSIVVAGCGDGGIRIFDIRCAQKNGVTAKLKGHTDWVLDAAIPQGNIHTIGSGDISGTVKYWDIRASESPRDSWAVHKGEMTAFAIHNYSDIFCTGTQNQKIRIADSRDGKEVNSVRYHDGLILGQRIGPVSCLAFHPYKLILAAGATDSIISMYRTSYRFPFEV